MSCEETLKSLRWSLAKSYARCVISGLGYKLIVNTIRGTGRSMPRCVHSVMREHFISLMRLHALNYDYTAFIDQVLDWRLQPAERVIAQALSQSSRARKRSCRLHQTKGLHPKNVRWNSCRIRAASRSSRTGYSASSARSLSVCTLRSATQPAIGCDISRAANLSTGRSFI